MFKELIAVWKGKTFLSEIIKDFDQMLIDGQKLFTEACQVWLVQKRPQDMKKYVYSTDQKINQEEQRIRRRLVEHLSVNPGVDVPACLVFMSLVKDAERIGDYAKNIFEVSLISAKGFKEDEYMRTLKEIQKDVSENFTRMRQAFDNSDQEVAEGVMKRHGQIARKCEELIRRMAKGALSGEEAVCFTLLTRYFKRVSAHIANIASSIVNPVEKIDFVREGLL